MDNPETLATLGTQDTGQTKHNTTQSKWQHRVHKTKKNNTQHNPEQLATQGTQDEDKQNKNNPEKLATQGTQDEEKQNKKHNTTQRYQK